MKSNEFITEANRGSVILVDFQPDYHTQDHGYERALESAIEYINTKRPKVMVFYNGEEVGMNDDKFSVIEHYIEHGLDEDLVNSIEWREKTYAWIRNWMDEGVDTSNIIQTLRYMVVNNLTDAREIDEEIFEEVTGLPEDEYSHYVDDLGIFFPQEINIADLKAMSKSLMGGGFRSECLAEIQILMNAFNIKYKLVDEWIYG